MEKFFKSTLLGNSECDNDENDAVSFSVHLL